MSEIVNATDNLLVSSNVQVIGAPNSVPNADPLANIPIPERVNQQKFLPNSVNARLIGDLLSNNPSSSALGSGIYAHTTISNGTSAVFSFTLTDNQGREVMAVPDVSFYIVVSGVFSHWPNTTYGMGNMPAMVYNDWGATDNFNTVTRAIIRNNTGSDQLVYVVCRFRIVTFPANVNSSEFTLNGGSSGSTLSPFGGGGGHL